MHNDLVRAGLGAGGVLVEDELLAAAEAVPVLAAVVDAARHLVGAQPGGQVRAPVGHVLARVRVGAADLAGRPEGLGEERAQDRDVGGDDADDGLAHTPAVDVGTARVGPEGQADADDGSGDHEETCADKETDNDFPVRRKVVSDLSYNLRDLIVNHILLQGNL